MQQTGGSRTAGRRQADIQFSLSDIFSDIFLQFQFHFRFHVVHAFGKSLLFSGENKKKKKKLTCTEEQKNLHDRWEKKETNEWAFRCVMFSVVGLSYSSAIGIRWATSARARHSHWLAGFHVDADRPDAVGGGQLLHQDRDVGLDELLALGFQESSLGAHFIQLVSNELEKRGNEVFLLFVRCTWTSLESAD